MNNNLFRKTSLDRVNSPEQLNEYIRVARPSIWIILSAVIILLLGVIIWGIFGNIVTTVKTGMMIKDGSAVCYVSKENADKLQEGMEVTFGEGLKGQVSGISKQPVKSDGTMDSYLRFLCGISEGEFVYAVNISTDGAEDGIYETDITVESIHPMQFLIQ